MSRALPIALFAVMVSACAVSGDLATTTAPDPGETTTIPPSPTSTIAPGMPDLQALAVEKVAEVEFPIQLVARPGDSFSYVLTKAGEIHYLDGDVLASEPVLDLSGEVAGAFEQGLLSMLLPDDPEIAYVSYTAENGDTIVSEFRFNDPTEIDRDSERVIFRLGQPGKNHNGGMLQMRDGLLYLSLGDGGGAGDQFDHAQNTNTLYGGIITLSPSGDPNPTLFVYGLRNPWRFWFDHDLMYIADVGQDAYEEVSVAPIEPGLNFGWPIVEGRHCYSPDEHCDPNGTVFPVLELEHGDEGACSITGGVVYRGSEIPELDGFYLYSDFCGGFLRGFRYLGNGQIESMRWDEQVGDLEQVTGFGVDGSGEVYIATGEALFRLVAVR